ncbi:MAG TPA: glycosyltransferase 87 family protein [Acidobacteriaceae bacterium]
MNAEQQRRVIRWVESAVLLLAICYLGLHTMPRAWRKLNTDFPNYYVTARLAHEGVDTARINEWVWLQREKDHRSVDIRLIAFLPITPFSTLAMWPVTGLAPLMAKHVWLLINLALLIPLAWMLRELTGLTWLTYRRIALIVLLSFPLHRDLLFGQFYLVLLVLIVAACWAYLREWYVLAGVLIAVAAACKVFPLLFFVFLLQRRNWRALFAGAVALMATIGVSLAVFGLNLHRTYVQQILPWTLRGEGMPPYAVSYASISGLMHSLFLYEPQWNPHPWHSSPLVYALLQPTLQMLVLAPAILLIRRGDRSRERTLLEWSALLTASLAISTMPASYHFVLVILPVSVLAAWCLRHQRYGWLAVLAVVYLGIGFPITAPNRPLGLGVMLYMPRLPLMIALLGAHYVLLARGSGARVPRWDWTQYAWASALAVSAVLSVHSAWRIETAVRDEYAYRLPSQMERFLAATPVASGHGVRSIAFTATGYHLVREDGHIVELDPSEEDDLTFADGGGHLLVERARSPRSQIVDIAAPAEVLVDGARDPILAQNGQSLAFVRDDHGRGQLFARSLPAGGNGEKALTPRDLNVYEASFRSPSDYAVAAVDKGKPPQIYLTDATHANQALELGETRYPALSPDGRWMVYSRLLNGMWNLWVLDRQHGTSRRVADVPCDQIEPSWQADSKTVLYATDCGRSIWFTAVAQRQIIP